MKTRITLEVAHNAGIKPEQVFEEVKDSMKILVKDVFDVAYVDLRLDTPVHWTVTKGDA